MGLQGCGEASAQPVLSSGLRDPGLRGARGLCGEQAYCVQGVGGGPGSRGRWGVAVRGPQEAGAAVKPHSPGWAGEARVGFGGSGAICRLEPGDREGFSPGRRTSSAVPTDTGLCDNFQNKYFVVK